MSWGKGITLTIFMFVGLMSFLIYKCIGVKTDLVTSDYYENALDYDKVQIAKSNYSRMASIVDIEKTEAFINLRVPELDNQVIQDLKADLYFPANKDFDKKIASKENSISVQRDQLQDGFYRVSLWWKNGSKDFLYEGSFIN